MSRGMKWTPFIYAHKHVINSKWLVCMDSKGTMRRAAFADETFKTLAGELITSVTLYANDRTLCQVIDEVTGEAKQHAKHAVEEAMEIVSQAQDKSN